MLTTTTFDSSRHHIEVRLQISADSKTTWRTKAILDTGAPWTEVSDKFLLHAGILETVPDLVSIPEGLQTQRYAKLTLPFVEICGQQIPNMEVRISRFQDDWGAYALIGLDFFRRFPVKIDYQREILEVG